MTPSVCKFHITSSLAFGFRGGVIHYHNLAHAHYVSALYKAYVFDRRLNLTQSFPPTFCLTEVWSEMIHCSASFTSCFGLWEED